MYVRRVCLNLALRARSTRLALPAKDASSGTFVPQGAVRLSAPLEREREREREREKGGGGAASQRDRERQEVENPSS